MLTRIWWAEDVAHLLGYGLVCANQDKTLLVCAYGLLFAGSLFRSLQRWHDR